LLYIIVMYVFRYDKCVFITVYDQFLPLLDLSILLTWFRGGGVTTPVTLPPGYTTTCIHIIITFLSVYEYKKKTTFYFIEQSDFIKCMYIIIS
jgi:hypothetical protein